MPWPSKRKRQLGNARQAKRQKQQRRNPPEERPDREPEGVVPAGEGREPEGDMPDRDRVPWPEGDVPDREDPELESDGVVHDGENPEMEGNAPDRDVSELFEDYARDWVNSWDRGPCLFFCITFWCVSCNWEQLRPQN